MTARAPDNWEAVIGLEVHVQLKTASKLFSSGANRFGASPNSLAALVDLGLPGVLPVLNRRAVECAIQFGLAVGGDIAEVMEFDRKHYFYPDLPKGYQISQLARPAVSGGSIQIDSPQGPRRIQLTRAHLEEDAGKSLHEDFSGRTGIDLNRSGTPLLEIVSEPEIRSAAEAGAYMRKLHRLVCWIGICDGQMAEGSLRCDANISLRRPGEKELGERCEIKNVNSFRFVEKALEYEIHRQAALLDGGGQVERGTLLYDEKSGTTKPMRGKEFSEDYRYFPDPDLLPVQVPQSWIDQARTAMPELPDIAAERLQSDMGIPADDAGVLTSDRDSLQYFEQVVAACDKPRLAANWINGELAAMVKEKAPASLADCPVTPERLAELLLRVDDGTISGTAAKQVLAALWDKDDSVDALIDSLGLRQVSDTGQLQQWIDEVLGAHGAQVADYKAGKTRVLGFLIGKVMQASGGQANPAQVSSLLREQLDKD